MNKTMLFFLAGGLLGVSLVNAESEDVMTESAEMTAVQPQELVMPRTPEGAQLGALPDSFMQRFFSKRAPIAPDVQPVTDGGQPGDDMEPSVESAALAVPEVGRAAAFRAKIDELAAQVKTVVATIPEEARAALQSIANQIDTFAREHQMPYRTAFALVMMRSDVALPFRKRWERQQTEAPTGRARIRRFFEERPGFMGRGQRMQPVQAVQ